MKQLLTFVIALTAGAGLARDLRFYPANSSLWDFDTGRRTWLDENGSVTYYADGDNVTLGQGFNSVVVNANVNPGWIVINTPEEPAVHSIGFSSDCYLGNSVTSVVKRGPATCQFTAPAWGASLYGFRFLCPLVIEEGTFEISGPGNSEPFSGGPDGLEYQVRNGATFRVMRRDTTGLTTSRISVAVADGGTFQLGPDPDDVDAYHVGNAISNLTLEGGASVKVCGLGPDGPAAVSYQGALNVLGTLTVSNAVGNAKPVVIDYADKEGGGQWSTNIKLGLNQAGKTPTCFDVADVTGDANADLTVKMPLAPRIGSETTDDAGFVKKGAGYLSLPVKNTIKGDVEIREGTLGLDRPSDWSAHGNLTSTCLGDMSIEGRTVTVSSGATLVLRDRHVFTDLAGGEDGGNGIKAETVVKGGTLSFYNVSGLVEFGPMTVWGGSTFQFNNAFSVEGAFAFRGTFHVTGTEPLVISQPPDWASDHPNHQRGDGLFLYPNQACVFDVDDVVRDGRTDFDLSLTIVYPCDFDYSTWQYGKKYSSYVYGFKKRGAGTMALNHVSGRLVPVLFDGSAEVEAGTLLVNADYSSAGANATAGAAFVVSAGAAIGGIGKIGTLKLNDGAGFAAVAGQNGGLAINDDVALPANGVLRVTVPPGADPKTLAKTTVFTVVGDGHSLTGTENLSKWPVLVEGGDGSPFRAGVTADGKGVTVQLAHGFSVIVR